MNPSSSSAAEVNIIKMEQSHSLLLNENAFRKCPDPQKNMFIYEWLRYLDRILPLTKKSDLKDIQQKLLEQLSSRISSVGGGGCAQPSRILLGRCIATLFTITDASHLFHTINTCNDLLKDPSVQTQVKSTALSVLGEMYENLGRIVGRSYEETFQAISKWMKSAESTSRIEILNTLAKMIQGLGAGIFPIYKDLFKLLVKALNDRLMPVRAEAAKCFKHLVSLTDSPLFAQRDLDSICTLCIKALHLSNYEVRQEIANIFAKLAISAKIAQRKGESSNNQKVPPNSQNNKSSVSLNELLQSLSNGMVKGGVGGFLKTAKTATGIQPGGQRETRIGIAEAYVAIAMELGSNWLKRNIQFWCRHLLDLASKCSNLPSTSGSDNFDSTVSVRRCIHFIFRSTIGKQLSESDQINTVKFLGAALAEYINSFDCAMDSTKEEERQIDADANASANPIIVCLMEIGCIALQVDTVISSIFTDASGILEPIFSCLLHPIQSVRIATAWCLKCVVSAIPSLAVPLIDRCLNRLEYLKKSPEAISGFSFALAAIVSQSKMSTLGIPFAKTRQIFTVTEELIKSATQTPRLMLRKVQSGWLIISAIISLGSPFIRPILPRLFTLWRISFPRSAEETKTERGCGDANSWEATLEARACALGSMATLVEYCPELVTDELAKRIAVPIETSLSTMSMVGDLLLMYGIRIRPAIQLLHLRLFTLLSRLPIERFESAINPLLKELVAEITLSDNSQSNQRTSLCVSTCSTTENTFLNGWIYNTELAYLEKDLNSLQTAQMGSFDVDPLLLLIEYKGGHLDGSTNGWWWSESQPLAVAALDSAIQLFARVFPIISSRCKLQLIQHFANQLKTTTTKPGPRLQALQLNILTAICLAHKTIGERRNGRIDDEQLQQQSVELVLPFLAADSILLKCLAAETMGRIVQAVSKPQFVASNAQFCFDKIRALKDETSRQGYALCLGTLHRYMGSLGSGQHLNTAIGILLALAQDVNCSSIKPWAIFSLSLIASTGGGLFCPYAEPVRNLCLQLLLNNSQLQIDVIRSIAKLIFALINAIGPELATTTMGTTIESTRNEFLTACSILMQFDDPIVKSEAMTCYQYIHLFAPRFVELDRLVVKISELLFNSNILLRKSAIQCLHQLLQHEIKEVREHVKQLIPTGIIQERELERENKSRILPETGLEGALFEMLDLETDTEIRKHIKQSVLFLLQTNSDELLGFWICLCKDILASSQLGQENLRSTLCVNLEESNKEMDNEISTNDDDILQQSNSAENREKLTPRWPTRVFAFEVIQKLLCLTETERAHLDLALAKELQMSNEDGHSDYLVLHLSDLVRMGFMGATSENDNLRIAGLNCLQNVITKFAKVAEPEFPGHVLLEQFQAQIGAALRPTFSPEIPGNITALACQVASTWICSGVARDLNDLRRIHQLLASSLAKLIQNSSSVQIYNENISTLEKLSILRAWSKIYISAIEQKRMRKSTEGEAVDGNNCLLGLVEAELETLIEYWFDALRDFAMLSLPKQFNEQIIEQGGTFFTPDSMEICKKHYSSAWPLILLACTVWIRQRDEEYSNSNKQNIQMEKRLYLMIGICLDLLNRNRHYLSDERPIQLCLSSLYNLFTCKWVQLELMRDVRMPIELMNVIYKLTLTRDSMQTQKLCLELVESILRAGRNKLVLEAEKNELDEQNGNEQSQSQQSDEEEEEECEEENNDGGFERKQPFMGGEGEDGIFRPNSSLVFATIEVLICTLTRQVPEINLAQAKIRVITPLHHRKGVHISAESDELIQSSVELLGQILPFCCTEGQIVVLPSLLNLLFGVLRECSRGPNNQELPQIHSKGINSAIKALQKVCSNCPNPEKESKLFASWESLMRSALLSLLNLAQNSQNADSNQSSNLLFAAIILFSSVSKATASPFCIGEQLFGQFCEIIRNSLHSGNIQLELKSIKSVRLLFQSTLICGPFIRELGNDIFSKIRPFVANDEMEMGENNAAKIPTTQEEIELIKGTIKTIEAILATAKDDRKRIFVSLMVRSLVQFIHVEQNSSPLLNELHEFALAKLNEIGCQHSEPLKILLQAAPEIKERIETAIQRRIAHQKELDKTMQAGKRPQITSSAFSNRPTEPTIKLTTDFTNLMK